LHWGKLRDRTRIASLSAAALVASAAIALSLTAANAGIATPTETLVPTSTASPIQQPDYCDHSYPTICVPYPPPDLDCPDIPYRNFQAVPSDDHHFDGDHDGIGCES
jgi:hypothetical protein